MRPGDNVYFFCNRTVYGIGEILGVPGKSQAAFEAEPDVTTSIDMDDLLRTNPGAFRPARAFWKRSLIQLDERENAAFKAAIIRLNSDILRRDITQDDAYAYQTERATNEATLKGGPIKLETLLSEKRDNKNGERLSSEMLVECGLIDGLLKHTANATDCFGEWDYVAHQVVAPPFKPVDYMDRIDVFGYRWVPGFEHEVIEKYLVVEIKKDRSINHSSAAVKDYEQLMKYVDWVCGEYAHGDYSMIEAYLLAADFDIDADGSSGDTGLIVATLSTFLRKFQRSAAVAPVRAMSVSLSGWWLAMRYSLRALRRRRCSGAGMRANLPSLPRLQSGHASTRFHTPSQLSSGTCWARACGKKWPF